MLTPEDKSFILKASFIGGSLGALSLSIKGPTAQEFLHTIANQSVIQIFELLK